MDKKNRTRAGLALGIVVLLLAFARLGKLTGRAGGGEDEGGGCSPPQDVSATKGGPVAAPAGAPLASREISLRINPRLRLHRNLGRLSRHHARPATPPQNGPASPIETP